MDDLTAWLRQQLDDDEQAAVAAGHASHFYDCSGECFDHHERWDDARVLAEVNAKRRILDEHQPIREPAPLAGRCERCHDLDDETAGGTPVMHPCPTVRLLGLPFAAEPGYRAEWRPEAAP